MSCKDCMEIPPVSVEYTEKGKYETIAGFKTYVTGAADATRAVIFIYDVFGFASQTLQGADRLAQHLRPNTVVLVPDLLRGAYVQPEWLLPGDDPPPEERQRLFAEFRAGPGRADAGAEGLLAVRREVGERWAVDEEEGKGGVAVGGLCWGGKVSVLVCGEGNEGRGRRFAAAWTAHPGRLDTADAEALTVPYICLASPGEDAEVVAKTKEIMSRPGKIGVVETYGPPMFHGWMGARANLGDETNAREFERGYKQVAEFLARYF